jgi:hypothetical protein
MNSHVNKLFVTVGVFIWMDNEHETTIKENDDGGWSSDCVML